MLAVRGLVSEVAVVVDFMGDDGFGDSTRFLSGANDAPGKVSRGSGLSWI